MKITHLSLVDKKNAPPGCSIDNPGAGERHERFCRAPGNICQDYADCYDNKQCQHEPPDEGEGLLYNGMTAPPAQPCKADVHYGPVTVSLATLRCSNCGYQWGIFHEGPGPK